MHALGIRKANAPLKVLNDSPVIRTGKSIRSETSVDQTGIGRIFRRLLCRPWPLIHPVSGKQNVLDQWEKFKDICSGGLFILSCVSGFEL